MSCTGYNIQDIANSYRPADPAQEARHWYQYYFHTERGRNGLDRKAPRDFPVAVENVVAGLGVR